MHIPVADLNPATGFHIIYWHASFRLSPVHSIPLILLSGIAKGYCRLFYYTY
jgi:hypothetical protein